MQATILHVWPLPLLAVDKDMQCCSSGNGKSVGSRFGSPHNVTSPPCSRTMERPTSPDSLGGEIYSSYSMGQGLEGLICASPSAVRAALRYTARAFDGLNPRGEGWVSQRRALPRYAFCHGAPPSALDLTPLIRGLIEITALSLKVDYGAISTPSSVVRPPISQTSVQSQWYIY